MIYLENVNLRALVVNKTEMMVFPELHSMYSIYRQSKKISCEANTEL